MYASPDRSHQVNSDEQIPYIVGPFKLPAEPGTEDELIAAALVVLRTRLRRGQAFRSPPMTPRTSSLLIPETDGINIMAFGIS